MSLKALVVLNPDHHLIIIVVGRKTHRYESLGRLFYGRPRLTSLMAMPEPWWLTSYHSLGVRADERSVRSASVLNAL